MCGRRELNGWQKFFVAFVTVFAVIAVVSFLTGCNGNPLSPNGGNGGGGEPARLADYVVNVGTYWMDDPTTDADDDDVPVRRPVFCTIAGYGADGDEPIIVTDARTGKTGPYIMEVNANTPARLLIYNYARVVRIEVTCTVFAMGPGENIHCEFLNGDETAHAPMFRSADYNESTQDPKFGNQWVMSCGGAINTIA